MFSLRRFWVLQGLSCTTYKDTFQTMCQLTSQAAAVQSVDLIVLQLAEKYFQDLLRVSEFSPTDS